MSATATAAPAATEEKKASKPLAPSAAILELQAKIYGKLNVTVDGTSASSTASEDTFYANIPYEKLPEGFTREHADVLLDYNDDHSIATLGAVGQKNIETLAANAKVAQVVGVVAGRDGVTNTIVTDRDYNKTIAGKEIAIKGRTTHTVDVAALNKTGQMGRVHAALKALGEASLK